MRVLVTGGAGYIGSHTVKMLEKIADKVVVYDNLSKCHKQAVPNSILVQGDLFDKKLLKTVLTEHKIEAVVHFAAFSLVAESMTNPQLYYHNNVQGTLSLLEVMLECSVNKLVFSSTAAVYGEPEVMPISEEALKNPTNVYGQTKLMMEQIMADYAKVYDFNYIALRYFNACGADDSGTIGEDHSPESHLIPLVLQTCLGLRNSIKIFGTDYDTADGSCVRDYIHVNDLGQAHILALQALYRGASSTAYNLGNGTGFSVKEIIAAAEEVTGIKIVKELTERRAGDPACLIASSTKIKKELQWQPQYTEIKDIIASAWQWQKNNPQGFAK